MKRILGLDVGTNSVGWAVVNQSKDGEYGTIEKLGSRIIPMDQGVMDQFAQGQTESTTAERTRYRGVRRLRERSLLRRERLHRVLHVLGFLPTHYDESIGWNKNDNKTYGKFLPGTEVKLAWAATDEGHRFLFYDSYLEMLEDLKVHQPSLSKTSETPIPLDWTIYYLRKKALTQPITKEELAWILLQFNQKRGYYQLRGEEEVVDDSKKEEYYALKVVKVELDTENRSKKDWYNIHLENGWIYRRSSNVSLDNWVGLTKEFIVTTRLDAEGNEKLNADGEVQRSFKNPSEDDWGLIKKKTESDLLKSGKTVGAYIYDNLLTQPNQKIIGGLIRTIERKLYREELNEILTTQCQFNRALQNKELFQKACYELYPKNENHRKNLLTKDFKHLFIEDILFYQRPLKTKKSLIANCPYEYRVFIKEGKKEIAPIKCIAKSNPYFQEIRLWQFIDNLKILEREVEVDGSIAYDVDVTANFFKNETDWVNLFIWLNDKKSVKQDELLGQFLGLKKDKGKKEHNYRWNYVEDRDYPCNETRALLLKALSYCEAEDRLDDFSFTYSLWHLLYSVEDKIELKSGLEKFALRHQLPQLFVEQLLNTPPFEKEYGSYSEKAIKRLLPLMRRGKYWDIDAIDNKTKQRIQRIIDGEVDDSISIRAREKLEGYRTLEQFTALPLWLAGYVVYSRHAESGDVTKWDSPEALDHYIQVEFKQYSLRNPIVEQIVLETLRVVKDLWSLYGDFSEIHLELGRDIKNSASVRNRISTRQQENENTRQRILNLLMNLKKEARYAELNPYSPSQQEKMRIVEEGVLNAQSQLPKDIEKIATSAKPSSKEMQKYLLWLDQKYCSPYTGKPISLARLFTSDYQIEHVIPQKRYFDDSFSNKVICEAEVNSLKGALLAHEFIQREGGSTITVGTTTVEILKPQEYVALVNRTYGVKNKLKAKKLLATDLDEVIDGFSARQLTDTRYINRVMMRLLSGVVRDKDEAESTSRNVIPCAGRVTSVLKHHWGLNDSWDKLIQPRFERLNKMTNSSDFGVWVASNRFQIRVPFDLQKGFSKKRIDHRHHALDALVIACTTRNHVNFISNSYSRDVKDRKGFRYDLRALLCEKEYNKGSSDNYSYQFKKPWNTFTEDAYVALREIVVSHKQNTRVLTKANNKTEYINSLGKKALQPQTKGDHWAIRKPLHQETIFGRTTLREVKTVSLKNALENNWKALVSKLLKQSIEDLIFQYGGKYDAKVILKYFKDREYQFNGEDIRRVEVYEYNNNYAATRKAIDDTLTLKQIDRITDVSIQNILKNHLERYDGNLKEAFNPEGLADMNKNIKALNGGKNHCPIYRVRLYEDMGAKFALGTTHNNPDKFAIAAKGTNLYFGVYEDEEGKRSFDSIPLHVVIERLKNKQSPVPPTYKNNQLKFYLSPNDLVYVPTEEEQKNSELVDITNLSIEQKERVYKVVSFTGYQCFCLLNSVAQSIVDKKEYSALNKMERAIDGTMIKQVCWKLKVNRLGKIEKICK